MLETKNNNLNEFYTSKDESKVRFYTSPDDIVHYRNGYNNFSFTPQSQLNINENNKSNVSGEQTANQQMFPLFPTIPSRYGGSMDIPKNELKLDGELFAIERSSNSMDKENSQQSVNVKPASTGPTVRNVGSTRHSTEENESVSENNTYMKGRKCKFGIFYLIIY